jgi:hypothetical protein
MSDSPWRATCAAVHRLDRRWRDTAVRLRPWSATGARLLQYLRAIGAARSQSDRCKGRHQVLDGVVEVDYKTFPRLSRDLSKNSLTSEKITIAVAIEMQSYQIRIVIIPDDSTTSITQFVRAHVKPRAIVRIALHPKSSQIIVLISNRLNPQHQLRSGCSKNFCGIDVGRLNF